MTPENLLLSALTAVTTALVWAVQRLWRRSEQCELQSAEQQQEIKKLQDEHLEYVKAQSQSSLLVITNNTIALQENTRALTALTKIQT